MSSQKKFVVLPIALTLILAVPLSGAAQPSGKPEGILWQVTWTDVAPADDLVAVDDTFRVIFVANEKKAKIKPLPPLRNRWGQDDKYEATLERQSNEALYCGTVSVKGKGHDATPDEHYLSLSVVDPDFLVLEFIDSLEDCRYRESHGGVVHANN